MNCKCQECGKQFKIDWMIDDELWEKIKPKAKSTGAGLLCGSCIMDKIELMFDYSAFIIKKIK